MRIQPVLAPAVSPVPLIYFEEYIDGVLARALVHIITQIDGVIYTDPKNFTGKTGIKPGSIDVNKIKALTPEDLHGHADCQEATEHAQPLVFAINYPVCELAPVKGKRESYGITFTCKDLIFTSPGDAPEKSSLEPNHLKLQGPKYPLENAPDSYVCDCDKSSD